MLHVLKSKEFHLQVHVRGSLKISKRNSFSQPDPREILQSPKLLDVDRSPLLVLVKTALRRKVQVQD
jgi:hypothetical protein